MDHEIAGLVRRNLFGIGIDALTMTQALSRCTDAIDHGGYLSVGMVNAAKVVAMRRSERLRDCHRSPSCSPPTREWSTSGLVADRR